MLHVTYFSEIFLHKELKKPGKIQKTSSVAITNNFQYICIICAVHTLRSTHTAQSGIRAWMTNWNVAKAIAVTWPLLTLSFFFLSGVMKPFLAFLALAVSSRRLRTSARLRSMSACLAFFAWNKNYSQKLLLRVVNVSPFGWGKVEKYRICILSDQYRWSLNISHRKFLLKHFTERRIEGTGRRGKWSKQLLEDLNFTSLYNFYVSLTIEGPFF